MNGDIRSAQEKALRINLDASTFGTFAEIGAGQEVARWFFIAGKSAATVAKSISAYDMALSNKLYGPTDHYVSRERLESILDHEYSQLVESLGATRGSKNAFFVFADTAATSGASSRNGGHGWLGVRFQERPGAEPSDVIVHVQMRDSFSHSQQEAVGLIGVNLLYGAFYHHQDPRYLVSILMEGLDRRRMEVDMIKFSGPAFAGLDNRLMSLQLVERGLTDAAMFTAKGEVVQPSEVLHERPVLIERGSFRPVTNVTLEMINGAAREAPRVCGPDAGKPVVLMEMTLNNLMSGRSIDHADFLARADTLGALDRTVLISNYTRFDCVTTYLRRYTRNWVVLTVGLPTLEQIFEEKYYSELPGGLLDGMGRLFAGPVKVFAYPTLAEQGGELATADNLKVAPNLTHLYEHLLSNGFIVPIQDVDTSQLHINPGEVLKMIESGDPKWETLVPAPAASLIKAEGLFKYRKAAAD